MNKQGMNNNGAVGRGFTLIEIIVVIAVIAVLAIIAVPAISAILASNQRTQAEEGVQTGLRLAREAAIRSGEGQDSAAAFFFEPGGVVTIVPYVKVTEITDTVGAGTTGVVQSRREVFVPDATLPPVVLPKNWTVRAYAPAGTVGSTAGGSSWYRNTSGLPRYLSTEAAWVFPESGFYDDQLNAGDDGLNRSTFIVRFEGGTGAVRFSSTEEVLLLSPRGSDQRRVGNNQQTQWQNANDRAARENPRRWVARIKGTLSETAAAQILGHRSGDMVLARPVTLVALAEESKLAAALGTRVHPETGVLYEPITRERSTPRFVQSPQVQTRNMKSWIEGDTDLDGTYNADRDVPEAVVFAMDRFSGQPRRVSIRLIDNGGRLTP